MSGLGLVGFNVGFMGSETTFTGFLASLEGR